MSYIPEQGHDVRLRDGVMWGGMFPMRVSRVFKNGWLEVRRTNENGRGTWAKVRHEDVEPDYCTSDYHASPHRNCPLLASGVVL